MNPISMMTGAIPMLKGMLDMGKELADKLKAPNADKTEATNPAQIKQPPITF